MGYLLSQQVLRALVEDVPEEHPVKRWLNRIKADGVRDTEIFISVINLGLLEDAILRFDPGNSGGRLAFIEQIIKIPTKFGERILPLTALAAQKWGQIRNQRDDEGHLVVTEVSMLVATALAYGLILVTRRQDWMTRLEPIGLKISDPWDAAPRPPDPVSPAGRQPNPAASG